MEFGRNIRLTFEERDRTQFSAGGNPSLVIEGLEVDFTVVRNLEKEPNTLTARVFNLSKDSRSMIDRPVANMFVTLAVSYDDDEPQIIFDGNLRQVRHMRPGPDLVTEIEAGDGLRAIDRRIVRDYKGSVGINKVLTDLFEAAEVGLGNLESALAKSKRDRQRLRQYDPGADVFASGITIDGYILDEAEKLLLARGLQFSIQNNQVQAFEHDKAEPSGTLPLTELSPTSGLVDSPSVNNEGLLEARILMIPEVRPGRIVRVKSEFIDGDYRVSRATYIGSKFGGDFTMDIEGVEVSDN